MYNTKILDIMKIIYIYNIIIYIILLLSNFIFKIVLYPLSLIILLLSIYRILSKNHNSRYKENYIYLNYRNILYSKINKVKYNLDQRKMYHIFKCPSCRQKVRIPKGKGKVTITCPKKPINPPVKNAIIPFLVLFSSGTILLVNSLYLSLFICITSISI